MKKILLSTDSAAGLSAAPAPVEKKQTPTVDSAKLLTDLQASLAALEKDAAILPPLLGFALTNLRGAVNSVQGHITASKK